MLAALDRVEQRKGDTRLNINMGRIPIKAKMAAQKRGIIAKDAFSRTGKATDPADKQLLQGKLAELEQEGYGHDNPFETFKTEKRKRKAPTPCPGDGLLKRYSRRVNQMSGSGMSGGAFGFDQFGFGLTGPKRMSKAAKAYREKVKKKKAEEAALAGLPPPTKKKKKGKKPKVIRDAPPVDLPDDAPPHPPSSSSRLGIDDIISEGIALGREFGKHKNDFDAIYKAIETLDDLPMFSDLASDSVMNKFLKSFETIQVKLDMFAAQAWRPPHVVSWMKAVIEWADAFIDRTGWDYDVVSDMMDNAPLPIPAAKPAKAPKRKKSKPRRVAEDEGDEEPVAPKAKRRKAIKPHARSRLRPAEDELYDEPIRSYEDWQDYFHGNDYIPSKEAKAFGEKIQLAGTLKSQALKQHLKEKIDDAAPRIRNSAYARRLLATELGPGDVNNFNKKMQAYKNLKQRAYPWIKPFMKEVKDYIIPIMMRRQDDHLEDIGDSKWVETEPTIEAMQEWGEDRTDRHPSFEGEGLNIAGAGLKLAGQGMMKSIHNKLYGLAKNHKGQIGAGFARSASMEIGKAMHRHAKKLGRAHIIPHLIPHIGTRLHHHIKDPNQDEMSGSGFWGNVWKGIKTAWKYGKKIGGPLLDAASYAAPFIAPEFAPALAGIQAARKFASKPSISGAKDLYAQATKKK